MPGDESENVLELDGGHDVSILDAAEIEAFLGGGREDDCDALDRDDMEEEEEEEEEEVEVPSASTFHGTIQEDLSRLVEEIRSKVNVTSQQPSFDPATREVEIKEVGKWF